MRNCYSSSLSEVARPAMIIAYFFLYYTRKLQKVMTTSYNERHVTIASGREPQLAEGVIRKHTPVGDGHKVHDHLSLGDYIHVLYSCRYGDAQNECHPPELLMFPLICRSCPS